MSSEEYKTVLASHLPTLQIWLMPISMAWSIRRREELCDFLFLCHIMAFWGHCAKFAFLFRGFLILECPFNILWRQKCFDVPHLSAIANTPGVLRYRWLMQKSVKRSSRINYMTPDIMLEIFNRSILINIWKFNFWLVQNRN